MQVQIPWSLYNNNNNHGITAAAGALPAGLADAGERVSATSRARALLPVPLVCYERHLVASVASRIAYLTPLRGVRFTILLATLPVTPTLHVHAHTQKGDHDWLGGPWSRGS